MMGSGEVSSLLRDRRSECPDGFGGISAAIERASKFTMGFREVSVLGDRRTE